MKLILPSWLHSSSTALNVLCTRTFYKMHIMLVAPNLISKPLKLFSINNFNIKYKTKGFNRFIKFWIFHVKFCQQN